MKKTLLFFVGLCISTLGVQSSYAQAAKRGLTRPITFTTRDAVVKKVLYPLAEMLKTGELELVNRDATALDVAGKTGVKLSVRENDGVAWLKNVDFTNGVIELDIKGKDVLQHSFVGVAFHGTGSPNTMDVVYFRPFNFRAPDSVRRIHAVQYVSLPTFDWEILREKYNGQYEKDIRQPPMADGWFHVKIVVKSPHVLVFVDGHSNPSLAIKKLSSTTHGKIGVWVGNTSDGEFANLTVTNEP